MAHVRGQIRDEIKDRLTGVTGTTGAPLDGLDSAVDNARGPLIAVSFGSESVERRKGSGDATEEHRALSVNVVLLAYNPTDLDVMLEDVEFRMGPELMVDVRHRLLETENQDPVAGEWKFFTTSLNYEVVYTINTGDASQLA